MGLDPRTPGSWPKPRADTQPLSHPGTPDFFFLLDNIFTWSTFQRDQEIKSEKPPSVSATFPVSQKGHQICMNAVTCLSINTRLSPLYTLCFLTGVSWSSFFNSLDRAPHSFFMTAWCPFLWKPCALLNQPPVDGHKSCL